MRSSSIRGFLIGAAALFVALASGPALLTGAKDAEAEMIYVDAALSIAYSARYTGGAWSVPALSGGCDGPAALAVAP